MNTLTIRADLQDFLETIKDDDTNIDTGFDLIQERGELFVTIAGVEYIVTVRKVKVA
jgi:hypothetical protein